MATIATAAGFSGLPLAPGKFDGFQSTKSQGGVCRRGLAIICPAYARRPLKFWVLIFCGVGHEATTCGDHSVSAFQRGGTPLLSGR